MEIKTAAVSMRNITKTFGSIVANNKVDLDIYKGEILSLLGENGSGKTTLMNMLSGIYFPDEGHIYINDKEEVIKSPKDALSLGIGMVHQHFKLIDVLSATENIILGLDGKLNIKEASKRIEAVFGVYFKLQSFVFMPVFGMNNGLVPIIAYNYGAKQKKRIMTAMKLGMLYAFCMLMLGFAAFQLCPGFLLQLFNASESMLSIGIPALRLISISFIFAAFSIISISMLQSLGHGIYSMFISVGRQLVVLVPAAYLLSKTGNLDLVWLAFPLAEIMSIVLSGIFLRKVLKTLNF